ncbi:transporter substrate-binding domain-containing protein [Rhizobium sp. SG2393]|uniref:transporter substrate-binding domain-containing protein n=1 Tax=Rhizobium sp. SG2393 TaxID=3276279 RepID=UPI00367244AB
MEWISKFLILCIVLGCTAARAEAQKPVFPLLFDARERIASPDLTGLKRLRFLTTVDFPPFNFIDGAGRISGFHVDLAREICRVLSIEDRCQIQAVPFDELQSALDKSEGEAVIAGLSVQPELRQKYAFSRPFMRLPARFAVANGITTFADLRGQPVGVVASTVHEAMAKVFFPDLWITPFPDRAALLKALSDGSLKAAFGDGVQLSFWVNGAQTKACCRLLDGAYFSQRFLGEGLTVMTRKADPLLNQAIDHALLDLSRSGRLEELYLRYFPNGIY